MAAPTSLKSTSDDRSASVVDGKLHFSFEERPLSLVLHESGVKVEHLPGSTSQAASPSPSHVPYLHVLSSTFDPDTSRFALALLHPVESVLKLWSVSCRAEQEDAIDVEEWASKLHSRAYKGITPCRRLLVLINPHGGKGTANMIWEEHVKPVLEAARCEFTLQHTGPSSSPQNARELARSLDLTAYDALVPISGDGIINELLNGLASRADALEALRIPISPIPGGSGNALSVNLHGSAGVADLALTALGAIKGHPIPLNLSSVVQGERRMFSFLSQAFGLAADLDIGTEWIRWLGDKRFLLGFLWGAAISPGTPVEITMNIVESEVDTMVTTYNTSSAPASSSPVPTSLAMPGLSSHDAAGAVHHTSLALGLTRGWHSFTTTIQTLYGGQLPWVSRGSMQFPLASGRDGSVIDLVVVPTRSFKSSLKALEGQDRGGFLGSSDTFYYKVSSYTCRPLKTTGYVSIDGESIPYEPFTVESHGPLARVLSLHGRFLGLDKIELEEQS